MEMGSITIGSTSNKSLFNILSKNTLSSLREKVSFQWYILVSKCLTQSMSSIESATFIKILS